MKRYLRVWLRLAHISFSEQIATRFSSVLFLLSKTLRFVFFLIFIFSLTDRIGGLAGYNRDQIIIFFLVFNFVDIATQLLFRGVYFFRQKVVNGEFDFYLVKPMSPLFRIMAGYTDFMDLITLIALAIYGLKFAITAITLTPAIVFSSILMIVFSFLISFSIHVWVVAIGILTTEVDNAIMVYRDLTSMARFPVDVYSAPVRIFLTYIVPVAFIMTVPAKSLMGLVSIPIFFISLLITFCSLLSSFFLWRYALSKYSSASS
ncbi:ABC-2 family transporter protein [Candidatus Collierbacteria bacterium]|nr:ABC-2 family transporter protein [Candidatus Collierbacteria bacterium]